MFTAADVARNYTITGRIYRIGTGKQSAAITALWHRRWPDRTAYRRITEPGLHPRRTYAR